MGAMTVLLTGIVSIVTFLTGSGVGAYSSLRALASDVAAGQAARRSARHADAVFASGIRSARDEPGRARHYRGSRAPRVSSRRDRAPVPDPDDLGP